MVSNPEYFQQYYVERKKQLYVIVGGENYHCARCGIQTDDLEFDHIDRTTKKFTIGTRIMQSWRLEKFQELLSELTKCQLLCINCHKEKTSHEMSEEHGWTHGTIYGFQNKKCSCKECLVAKNNYQEERNTKRRKNGSRGPYGIPADHGTLLCYRRGCKCDECKSANNENARQRRENKARIAQLADRHLP
jgi:hypothetical protein